MYNIEFYEDSNGRSELWEFLESLRVKAATNKDARIQYKQISLYIQLLEDNGTRLNENITKHLDDDIWELRPGNNRVLYFYFKNDTFVLLHQFRKKTQKTPKREIERAKAERDDYLARNLKNLADDPVFDHIRLFSRHCSRCHTRHSRLAFSLLHRLLC